MLSQHFRRTFTTRVEGGFSSNKFLNKCRECYHKEYFVCTPKTPFNNSPSSGNTTSGGVMVEHEESNNATFCDGEYKIVKDVVARSHVAVAKSTRPIVNSSTEEGGAQFNFADGYGISLHDRSLSDVLGSKESEPR